MGSWNNRSGLADQVDRIRMTESERSEANASLEHGENIAAFILGAYAVIAAVMHGVERAVRALTRSKSVS